MNGGTYSVQLLKSSKPHDCRVFPRSAFFSVTALFFPRVTTTLCGLWHYAKARLVNTKISCNPVFH